MAEVGFPAQHMTTTTVTSNTTVQTNLRYDPSYIRRKVGVLKIFQIVLSFIGFICIQCTKYSHLGSGEWYSTVSMFGVWITGILLLCYLFHVVEKFYNVPWLTFEMFFCAIEALCFLIASCIVVVVGVAAFEAAGFFGFCAMVAYGIDAYLKYMARRSGELAQGDRFVNKESTSVITPTY